MTRDVNPPAEEDPEPQTSRAEQHKRGRTPDYEEYYTVRRRVRLTWISDEGEAGAAQILDWKHLNEIRLEGFRRESPTVVRGAGPGQGMILAEIHPAQEDSHEAPTEPERDADTLRSLAGVYYYPEDWAEATTARNYKAIVGRGDHAVVAWSGNADYWAADGVRDSVFKQFGDDRTLKVIQLVLKTSSALESVKSRAEAIDGRVSTLDLGPRSDFNDDILTLHRDLRTLRRDLRRDVLRGLTSDDVAAQDHLRRLTGLHRTLLAEIIPERSVREVEKTIDSLQHDVEFLLARRSEQNLQRIMRGTEDEQRARFVQSVVILILAGAALFTGILAIPEIFPATYPKAGLWSLLILMASVAVGFLLHQIYQRPGPDSRSARRALLSAAILLLLVLASLAAGLTGLVPQGISFAAVLLFSLLSVLLLAWRQNPARDGETQ